MGKWYWVKAGGLSVSVPPGFRRWLLLAVTIALLVLAPPPLLAQLASPTPEASPVIASPASEIIPIPTTGNQVDGYPVMLDDQIIFRVRQGIPGLVSAAERAKIISERLQVVANDPTIAPADLVIKDEGEVTVIQVNNIQMNNFILLTISERDRAAYGNQTRQQLAQRAKALIETAIIQYRERRSFRHLLLGLFKAVVSTAILIGIFRAQAALFPRLFNQVRVRYETGTLGLRIGNFRILGAGATHYLLVNLLKALRLLLILTCLYLYLPFVLQLFPATEALGNWLLQMIAYQANQLIQGFIAYLPNLVTIILVILVTYYALGLVKLVINELGRDDSYPWFYPEWTAPTTRLVSFLVIAIASIIAGPYLPGFGSPVFRGLSIFLGVLFSLGSTSVIANAISGVILIYTRAFQLGDLVKMGDAMGVVIETSLFVTRLRTSKNVVVTLPNSTVLNSHVLNFSATVRQDQGYLLVHTTITLGYDIPWRKIHQVLVEAALATKGIVPEPKPFVLQTALNDFHVSYELNAYTDLSVRLFLVYSELHQNIQDYCNQNDIEILSPAYTALRDGNHSTIPANYLPADYVAPSFRVQAPEPPSNGHSPSPEAAPDPDQAVTPPKSSVSG